MDSSPTAVNYELVFDAHAHNTSGFRSEITVYRRGREVEEFDLPCDEGAIVGGGGTAPWPLCYFASGFTGCLVTHLRMFADRLKIDIGEISVNTRCNWKARQSTDATYDAMPIAFTMEVDFSGSASNDEKRRVVDVARKGCFVEQSLKPEILNYKLKLDGEWVDL